MSVWVTDAERHSELSDRNVYTNRAIEAFLSEERLFWVVASKGMGKTLMLRYKRELTERSHRERGVLILPELKTLDYVRVPTSLPFDATKGLQHHDVWKDLWEVSITFSILFSFSFPQDSIEGMSSSVESLIDSGTLPAELAQGLQLLLEGRPPRRMNPSDVLVHLMQISWSALQKFRRFHMHVVHNLYTMRVRSGVFVFIDSFDQALRQAYPDNLKIWVEGQLGLLLAAWEVSRHNPHIKIYTSIRQEAYAAFRHENRQAIFGSMLMLKYSREDLESLLDKSVSFFESKSSLSELIGLAQVRNEFANDSEDVFAFTHRHLIAKPRSFMVAGGEISKICGNGDLSREERERRFRSVLYKCASEEICHDYLLGEMSFFLKALKDDHNRKALFRLIHRNILTKGMLKEVIRQFNRVLKQEGVWPGRDVNPMCELYNIGLLGSLVTDPISRATTQVFRKPFEFDCDMDDVLPDSKYYFLHPSLHRLVSDVNSRYRVSQIVIGDECPWLPEFQSILRAELLRVFVSYSTKDSAMTEKIMRRLGDQLGLRGAFVDFWYDKWKVKAGQWIQQAVEKGLENCDILLVLLSKNSLESNWVNREWRNRFKVEIDSGRICVVPVLIDIDEDSLPEMLRGKRARRIHRRPEKKYESNISQLCDDILSVARDLGKDVELKNAEEDL